VEVFKRLTPVIAKLSLPIVAIEEFSGIAVTIPAGATVDYESSGVVLGVADLQWNGQTYFANVEDILEASWGRSITANSSSAWVN
jgi:hypothetical protein